MAVAPTPTTDIDDALPLNEALCDHPCRSVHLAQNMGAGQLVSLLAINMSPLNDGGPVDDKMLVVYGGIFWASLALGIFTAGMLLIAFFRFRRKHDDDDPEQTHGNSRLEIAWTLIPFAILFSLFILTASNMGFINNQNTAANAITVGVEGQQYQWLYHYPNGATSVTKMYVPAGVPIDLNITSKDVNHSFYIPNLGGQMNAIPGQTNHLWFTASKAGTYWGQCTELCGWGHHNMLIEVIALPYSQYNGCVGSAQNSVVRDTSSACQPAGGSA